MATIRKRGPNQFQARIKGYPAVSKTFQTKQEALSWSNQKEALILQGYGDALKEAERLLLRDALERYATEVSTTKKSQSQEIRRIRFWQSNPLASLPLAR